MDFFKWVNSNDVQNLKHLCSQVRATKPRAVEVVDRFGNTPLLRACYKGHYEAACTLLRYGGASVKAINYFGQNALTLATHSGNCDLVVELLKHRSYDDFNLSSIIPALMVAVMRHDTRLITYYRKLDKYRGEKLRTVHGLNAFDVSVMFGDSNHAKQST